MRFVTSDNHFGHANIIGYCKRPFADVDEMDDTMISLWNETVSDNDTVIHLGDFCLGNREMALKYMRQLNGHIIMLVNLWHHDKRWVRGMRVLPHTGVLDGINIDFVDPIYVENQITFCHFPLEEWHASYHGAVHLHGHQHGNGKILRKNRLDVSVDCTNFRPITIDEAIERARRIG